jgi:hypothetical protein
MPIVLEPRAFPLALLIALSLAGCDKKSGGSETTMTMCTAETKVCADGSEVVRRGPNCEFAPCPPPPQDELVACTKEAKLCPDGSAVGRQGPNCEFAPCPGETSAPPE